MAAINGFDGFSPKTSEFLWELSFNNERTWFLAHKDEFERVLNAPFKALAEETEKKGTVKVWFPNTVGVPDEFSQVESIILDIIPCHLLVEFYFRYLTWLECERVGFTWQSVEDTHHTWESFEKAVPEEE